MSVTHCVTFFEISTYGNSHMPNLSQIKWNHGTMESWNNGIMDSHKQLFGVIICRNDSKKLFEEIICRNDL